MTDEELARLEALCSFAPDDACSLISCGDAKRLIAAYRNEKQECARWAYRAGTEHGLRLTLITDMRSLFKVWP